MIANPAQAVVTIARREAAGMRLLGTGFAVGPNELATAYHVVSPNDSSLFLMIPRIISINEYQDASIGSATTAPVKIIAANPVRDIAILSFEGNVPIPFQLDDTDSLEVGDSALTLGFPHAPMGRMILTQQQAFVGARILISNSGIKTKHIVLNTQAREGQSGGPVLDSRRLQVVAMVIGSYAPEGGGLDLMGVNPATLHQTTHTISAEYLKEML